jgi:hypothetical protein
VVLILVILFKKQITKLISRLKTANIKGGILEFGKSPADKEIQPELATRKGEEISIKPKDAINWNKSGTLYWLGHDLMWTIDVLLRGGQREDIIHGLKQSLHHVRSLGFKGTIIEDRLKELKIEAENSLPKDWTDLKRSDYAIRLTIIKRHIGVIAEANQQDYEPKPKE